MKNTIIIIGIFWIALLFVQCENKELLIGDFTRGREDYTGTEINTAGYWYYERPSGYEACFLYKNGVVLYIGIIDVPDSTFIPIQIQKISTSTANPMVFWGMFKIENDSIFIQERSWYGYNYIVVYEFQGKVINDSTFVVTYQKKESPKEPQIEPSTCNRVYHFRSYSPKPDSTNVFVQ